MFKNTIQNLTKQWIHAVTIDKNPHQIARLFSKDAILLGTVSSLYRRGQPSIAQYFNYFASLPNLKVISHIDNVSRINSTAYVNNSLFTWSYTGFQPMQTRMTFIFRKENVEWRIFELHSSILPPKNRELFERDKQWNAVAVESLDKKHSDEVICIDK
jgi:uncharacterized protein (TIGR02246 family)